MNITAALLVAAFLARFANAQLVPQSTPRTPAGKPGTVDGLVTNSVTGDTLRKAVVMLQGVGNMQVMTDVAGRFHFDNVQPGSYVINVSREGFMNLRQRHVKTVKVGEEENVKDVAVALDPLARVSGHVFDEDGDPVMLASIQALRYGYNQGRKQLMWGGFANSNDLGEFQFLGLEPGRYIFFANAPQRAHSMPRRTRFIGQVTAYPPTYYPSAVDAAQATASDLASGANVANIDFRLRKVPAFHVRGTLVDAMGQRARNGNVTLTGESAGFINRSGVVGQFSGDGTFDFPAVVPGTYFLTATFPRSDAPPTESASQRITVTDQDLDGITLVPSNGLSVSGRFSVEGPAPTQMSGQVTLQAVDGFGRQFSGAVQQDGTFTLENVRPGSYLMQIFVGAPGVYVKSIRFGDTDASNGSLTLTQGSTGTLNIGLGTDGGQVQGTIQTASGALAATGIISLFPAADLPGRRDLVKQAGTDGRGNFKFQDVAPGEYKVFVWEESTPDVLDVPEFRKALESRAASVTVQPGGRETVQVQVIPVADVEAEKNKLQ